MWVIIFVIVCIVYILLPLIPACKELYYPSDIEPLDIEFDHDRGIERFAEQFSKKLREEIAAIHDDGRTMQIAADEMNPPTLFIISDKEILFRDEEVFSKTVNRRLVGIHSICLPNNMEFMSEMYAEQSILTGEDNKIRAAMACSKIVLGSRSMVFRWIHAKSIDVGNKVELYGRASAEESICFIGDAIFERIKAPVITFGLINEDKPDIAFNKTDYKTIEINAIKKEGDLRTIISGDLVIDEGSLFRGDLIVRGNLVVKKNSKIEGSIKVHGMASFEKNIQILGNIFATKDIVFYGGCFVQGVIVSEGEIKINERCQIGSQSHPVSVSAPIIKIASNGTAIYGSIWAVKKGRVLSSGAFYHEE